jgi:selenocysteine lyase/cysteine desulfurase
VVALNLVGVDSGRVADALEQRFGIAVRAGAHCAPLAHQTFGTQRQGAVRFSFSSFNREDEVEQAVLALKMLEEE